MYWRQRVIIELISRTPKKRASKLQLVKWLFLLRHEKEFDSNPSFYDFFPHKYGPFSFQLYKDLYDMQTMGTISFSDRSVECSFKLRFADALPKAETRSVVSILEEYGTIKEEELLDYVYNEYPWYASRSVLRKISQEMINAPPAVYTLGYEGLSIDSFLKTLLIKGLGRLVDVRNNPFSRKYGFSSNQLKEKCREAEIEYHHFPELGIPSSIRKSQQDLWKCYEEVILKEATKSVNAVTTLCREKNSVLLCFEQDPNTCHRKILARHISSNIALPVYHYERIGNRWRKE